MVSLTTCGVESSSLDWTPISLILWRKLLEIVSFLIVKKSIICILSHPTRSFPLISYFCKHVSKPLGALFIKYAPDFRSMMRFPWNVIRLNNINIVNFILVQNWQAIGICPQPLLYSYQNCSKPFLLRNLFPTQINSAKFTSNSHPHGIRSFLARRQSTKNKNKIIVKEIDFYL